ncbi:hypothetical protein [uncultured Ruminococcus sp.]|uniref:hypothetical protein n=1 Tax=uncultured Ruminococcus sp. TaxID=165186 RepID=UPI002613034D|nr:hypothetical protein [uncultured Ruminococcus sp.]
MKTKLRRFVSILSAMVLMICCAVPAFALKQSDGSGGMKLFIDMALKKINSDLGFTPDSYIAFYSPNRKEYSLIYLVPNSNQKFYWNKLDGDINTLNNTQFIISNYHQDSVDNKSYRYIYHYNDNNQLKYNYNMNFYEFSANIGDTSNVSCGVAMHVGVDSDNGADTYVYYHNANVCDWSNRDKDPNAPIVPFSVQYSRKLTTGMSRSGTLSAPGAKNDGESITNNNIDVTVKLTDEYKQAMQKALDKDPKATQYTYQYVLFITPYDPNIFGTKKAMDGAIYTFLDKSKYVLTTAYGKTKSNTTTDSKYDTVSTPDSSSADTSSVNVGEMTSENADGVATSAFCNGVTPLFGLPIANGANMTNTHTINLENIKGADKLGEQDILYIVVVGKRYLYETGAEGYAKDFYANNAEFKTFYKELPDNAVASKINGLYGGNGYDFYTVVSDGFSFKDYPDYKPLEINGVEYPTDKSISDMLDDPFPPSKFTDYDGLENGTDFDTKEDFDDYISNKKYDEEFGSFSFNLSDISSIFDSTSDFFKFLTASIGLMPSIFITVLIAFFTIMLGICVVKWVIK